MRGGLSARDGGRTPARSGEGTRNYRGASWSIAGWTDVSRPNALRDRRALRVGQSRGTARHRRGTVRQTVISNVADASSTISF